MLRRGAPGQQLLRRSRGSRPAVRRSRPTCATGTAAPAAADPLGRGRDQRPHEAVELVLGAVVGVQRDVDRVVLGDLGGVRGERDRAADHVLDGRAGEVLGAAGGDLDDAVGPGVGEALQRGVQRLRRRDVDGREGERPGLGRVEHLGVVLGGGDRHGDLSSDDAWVYRHPSGTRVPSNWAATERRGPTPARSSCAPTLTSTGTYEPPLASAGAPACSARAGIRTGPFPPVSPARRRRRTGRRAAGPRRASRSPQPRRR